MRTLLKRVVEIAVPEAGCPKVLMAVARLVGQEWLEGGDLRVELTGDDANTTLTIMCDYGVGIRERLLPPAELPVPLDEFSRALELSPRLVLPLRITDEVGKIILTPLLTPEHRSTETVAVRIDERSLGDQDRQTVPPLGPAEPEVTPEAKLEASKQSYTAEEMQAKMQDVLAALELEAREPSAMVVLDAPPVDPLSVLDAPDATSPSDLPPTRRAPSQPDATPDAPGATSEAPAPVASLNPSVHTRPTVRRMVAVDVSALRKRDPRQEEE